MELRRAKLSDVESMIELINGYAEQGLMLPRSRNVLYEGIREFLIAEEDQKIIGVGSLHILWEDLAEIRALAIASDFRGKSLGSRMVEELVKEAHELGCERVFALTYQPDFFKHCGFRVVSKEEMPHKVWKECINCVKFPNCDEIAVVLP
ncbi:MAG: N-acetyltransferase [Desulfitobacteriaceae bacterium]|nr:N-acetyltransferase [Desulfitobacteriaceae bacterium]MDI6879701.1 N-acetyltransferase [Desulfitobacteriaceae bacterium]MDI6915146.1 N-acetyltransferase [Desulfitobacteriaceae bacterium]